MGKKIVQIVPADSGWRAVYGTEEPWEDTELSRVVAWALVEDEQGEREIVGMVVDPVAGKSIVPAGEAVSTSAGELLRYGFKGA